MKYTNRESYEIGITFILTMYEYVLPINFAIGFWNVFLRLYDVKNASTTSDAIYGMSKLKRKKLLWRIHMRQI